MLHKASWHLARGEHTLGADQPIAAGNTPKHTTPLIRHHKVSDFSSALKFSIRKVLNLIVTNKPSTIQVGHHITIHLNTGKTAPVLHDTLSTVICTD